MGQRYSKKVKLTNFSHTSFGVKNKKVRIMANRKKEIQKYSSKFINSNFRIKVFGRDENGKKINTLMGVSGIIRLIGEELFYKFVQRAIKSMMDVCVCKLRRGLQVSLYVK